VFSFYLNQLTYSVLLVSEVEFSDSSVAYNSQCSCIPSRALLMPITRLPHPPSPLPSSLCFRKLLQQYGWWIKKKKKKTKEPIGVCLNCEDQIIWPSPYSAIQIWDLHNCSHYKICTKTTTVFSILGVCVCT